MKNSTIKINKFTRKIKEDADEQIRLAEEEMKRYRKEQLSHARQEYEAETQKYIKHQIEKGENEISAEISELHLQARGKLVLRRSEIVDDVISEAGKELIEFTKTDEYISLLEKSASFISKHLHSNKIILYVKAQDLVHADRIKNSFGKFCTVQEDSSIKIGGIRGFDAILLKIIDETLDEKLLLQREVFAHKSSLTISIR